MTVIEHLGRAPLVAEAWASGLEPRESGFWPQFDIDILERALRRHTLVADTAATMIERVSVAQLLDVPRCIP